MRRAASAALLALAACRSATAPPRPPSAIEITVSAQEAPPAPVDPPPEAPVASAALDILAPPAAVGCALVGTRVFTTSRKALPLCLAAEGPCFASSARGAPAVKVTVTFPEGDAVRNGALVELDDGHVAVRGWTRAEAVPLSSRILFTLGTPRASADFVAPVGDVLEVESAAQGTASVALRLGSGVTVEGGVARAERRCNELQLDAKHVDAATVARFVGGKQPAAGARRDDLLPLGKDTPLSSEPGEPPVAMLRPGDELDDEVEVLERRGRRARIFWLREGYAVFGWIPAAALRKRAGGEPGGGVGGVPGGVPGAPGPSPSVCNEDVPLLVEVAGRHVEIGKVRKGTPMRVTGRGAGYAVIELGDAVAALERGAAWALREADVARACVVR